MSTPTSRRNFLGWSAAGWLGWCCGCRSVPLTGRRQLVLVPEPREIALGVQAYDETMSEAAKSTDATGLKLVQRVGQRIAAVANRPDYQWQFELLDSPDQNAFCLPGGKVAVYEGILPVCDNEAGLAVVMSHEIAHALARHGGERMSQGMAVDGVKQVVDLVTTAKLPDRKEAVMRAYGVASEVGILLPYSRKQEAEADHIGIMLMAEAGYDPQEAPKFWQRFGQTKGTSNTPEFLSTHPSDNRRAENLKQLVGEANERYGQATQKFGTGDRISAA